jgi:hypothetical protein
MAKAKAKAKLEQMTRFKFVWVFMFVCFLFGFCCFSVVRSLLSLSALDRQPVCTKRLHRDPHGRQRSLALAGLDAICSRNLP